LKPTTHNSPYWVPVLVWLGVIAIESFSLSSNITGGWLEEVLRLLHIHLSASTFATFHHLLRKAGHVTGYGILCLLVFRAWYHTLFESSRSHLLLICAVLALGITLATAVLDEWHQSFDPARTSSIWDVGLDVTGGIIFLIVALFVLRVWRSATTPKLISA
jgi:VanZ family protein